MSTITNPLSIASQFAAVEEKAAQWTFETLFNWTLEATKEAHRAGALSKREYEQWCAQLVSVTTEGNTQALYNLHLQWMWEAILVAEGLGTLRGSRFERSKDWVEERIQHVFRRL